MGTLVAFGTVVIPIESHDQFLPGHLTCNVSLYWDLEAATRFTSLW